MSFVGKVVIITGGSGGIGAATAVMYAKEGADVAIVGRNEEKLKQVSADCEKVGKAPLIIKADLAKDEEVKSIVDKVIEKYKRLDVLVNNAGMVKVTSLSDDNLIEIYDEVMRTNLRAVIILTQLAVPHLKKTEGHIVNVSSTLGQAVLGCPQFLTYNISKAGLEHFTRCVAVELAPSKVKVNTVAPGPVRTEILESNGIPCNWDEWAETLPLKRVSDPEEIADVIVFLTKTKSVTGSCYVIDNGVLIKG